MYVVDSDGQNLHSITPGAWGMPHDPDWSPDGGKIVYVNTGILYTVDGDGKNEQQLTTPQGVDSDDFPAWSPDGRWVAFERTLYDLVAGTRNEEIYITKSDGTGQPTRLTNYPGDDTTPSWSLENQHIAFASDIGNKNLEIYKMDITGNNLERLTYDSGFDRMPNWGR